MDASIYAISCLAQAERKLFIAIIVQALLDTRSNSKKHDAIFAKHEAICWLTGRSRDFVDICFLAGFSPDYVARKAKEAIANPIALRAEAGKGTRYEERKNYREFRKRKKSQCHSPIQ
ncbi:MAG: hypothetical protein AABY33_10740 [Pseudomonadota bacterium]